MLNNIQNTSKKIWNLPSLTVIPSSRINGGNQGALAVAFDVPVFLEQVNNPSPLKLVTKPVADMKKPARISLLRFAGYCVLLVIMLPLLLVGTKRGTHRFY